MTAIIFWRLIWLEQKQVDCTKQGLAPRRCQEKRYMYFVLDTVRMYLKNCFADHIVFNSPSQLLRFGKRAKQAGKSGRMILGIQSILP